MNLQKRPVARSLYRAVAAALFLPGMLLAAGSSVPPAVGSGPGSAVTESERAALVSWTMGQPAVQAAFARHRTRLLRVWLDVGKEEGGPRRRAVLLLRDYDTGSAREISVDLSSGRIEMRELAGVQPSEEEIDEGMRIVRRDPALARFVENPFLRLIGGFHSRSAVRNDPCALEVCLEFAFMKPNYEGPARYVVVNLTRGIVAHHDFRGGRPGGAPARMTETSGR
jgi:hypothetical protein